MGIVSSVAKPRPICSCSGSYWSFIFNWKENGENMNARLVNVIVVEDGTNQSYFTLEGIEIGSFKSGKQESPKLPEPKKPKGGVVGRPSPEEVREKKVVETESTIDKIRKKEAS